MLARLFRARRTAKAAPPLAEIGVSGLNRAGGYVTEEFLPQLSGGAARKVYREMADNDPVVGAILFAFTSLARQVEWRVQAAGEEAGAQEAAAFVAAMMDGMSHTWQDFIDEALTMLPHGFAPMEIVWKKDPASARIGVRKIALRAQETVQRWAFDRAGGINGLYQWPPDGPEVFIPIGKLLLFRVSAAKNNPEGRSILRTAYRPWLFKKRIEEIEGIGVERDLAGLPVIRLPAQLLGPDASSADKKALADYRDLVRNIRRDAQEGVLLPSDRDRNGHLLYELELLSTGGRRQFDTTRIIDRYDRRIATSVLADFIFLGQGSTGSWALSSDKTRLFATAIGAYLGTIRDVINRFLLPRLWALNGFDSTLMPSIGHGDIERVELDKLAQFITALSGAGAPLFPDRELENHLRAAAGMPLGAATPRRTETGAATAAAAERSQT